MVGKSIAQSTVRTISSPFSSVVAAVKNGQKAKFLIGLPDKFPKSLRGKFFQLSIGIIVILVALAIVFLVLTSFRRYSVSKPIIYKSILLGKPFDFPIRNGNGEIVRGVLKMTLTSAEKTNQILIKGRPATARDGKVFLIINMELDNPTQNKLGLAPVELIRLVDPSGKRFAPDVHNDKVTVEAISIKKTRVGFVVDENVSGWKLQVGEVGGQKEIFILPI